MGISLAVAGAILALTAVAGWRNHARESVLEQERAHWRQKAREAGLTVEPGISRRTKVTRIEAVKEDLVGFARQVIAQVQAPQEDEAGDRMLDRLERMDPELAAIILNEVEKDPALDAEKREELRAIVAISLGVHFPGEALALLARTDDLDPGGIIDEDFIGSLLKRRAQVDPQAALAWLRDNALKNPELLGDEAKGGLIEGLAGADPRFAFQSIHDLKLEDFGAAVAGIIRAGTNDAERRAAVEALREELGKTRKEARNLEMMDTAWLELAKGALDRGLRNSRALLDGLEMSDEEMAAFSIGALGVLQSGDAAPEDVAGWLEWVAAAGPAGEIDEPLGQTARQWASSDPWRAAKWLEGAPEGALREMVRQGIPKGGQESAESPDADY